MSDDDRPFWSVIPTERPRELGRPGKRLALADIVDEYDRALGENPDARRFAVGLAIQFWGHALRAFLGLPRTSLDAQPSTFRRTHERPPTMTPNPKNNRMSDLLAVARGPEQIGTVHVRVAAVMLKRADGSEAMVQWYPDDARGVGVGAARSLIAAVPPESLHAGESLRVEVLEASTLQRVIL